jgi:hypothetical protein
MAALEQKFQWQVVAGSGNWWSTPIADIGENRQIAG